MFAAATGHPFEASSALDKDRDRKSFAVLQKGRIVGDILPSCGQYRDSYVS